MFAVRPCRLQSKRHQQLQPPEIIVKEFIILIGNLLVPPADQLSHRAPVSFLVTVALRLLDEMRCMHCRTDSVVHDLDKTPK